MIKNLTLTNIFKIVAIRDRMFIYIYNVNCFLLASSSIYVVGYLRELCTNLHFCVKRKLKKKNNSNILIVRHLFHHAVYIGIKRVADARGGAIVEFFFFHIPSRTNFHWGGGTGRIPGRSHIWQIEWDGVRGHTRQDVIV